MFKEGIEKLNSLLDNPCQSRDAYKEFSRKISDLANSIQSSSDDVKSIGKENMGKRNIVENFFEYHKASNEYVENKRNNLMNQRNIVDSQEIKFDVGTGLSSFNIKDTANDMLSQAKTTMLAQLNFSAQRVLQLLG